MKTTQLIELQKAITQGEWQVAHSPSKDLIIQQLDGAKLFPPMLCTMSRWQDAKEECEHNATAISLIPSLLREVVELRDAMQRIKRIADVAFIEGGRNGYNEIEKLTRKTPSTHN